MNTVNFVESYGWREKRNKKFNSHGGELDAYG